MGELQQFKTEVFEPFGPSWQMHVPGFYFRGLGMHSCDFVRLRGEGNRIRRIGRFSGLRSPTTERDTDAMYSTLGRPSIPPERLLKASLLMALHTLRSERLLCEQLDYNFLFRWFLDMEVGRPNSL